MQREALKGLRVVDLTTTIAGPHCTRLLADLGADVIKIEGPEGDMMRTRPPLRSNASTSFGQLNAGKRSVVLDLKDKRAQLAVRKLVAKADVLVENYRPGVTRRLGLDYATVAEENPRLVYCSISGYGQTGPSAELAAYAPVIHAASGYDLAHMAYQPGRTQPDNCGVYIADVLTGTYAFGAIMAAINQRHVTGKGQHVDVSMLESMLTLTLTEMQAAQFTIPPPPRRHMFSPVATKDGYIHIAVASERTFQGLAEAAGRMDWITDPRFQRYLDRRSNWAELMDELESWSRTLPAKDVLAALERSNVPASPYRSVAEVMQDPQLDHRDAFTEVRDQAGSFKALNPPFRMSASATRAGEHAAALGEHTAAVLAEAGLGRDDIAALTGGKER
ncbi:MAG: CaiB/BaiF CoA-transferase family protein [Hyphomicrobiaceae bacterium]|nr:CaiB/BaiF CoA-transferase family protein [Hyphomicrobiaceae bacterium]